MSDAALKPIAEMVTANDAHQPNESAEYRQARNALLAKEIELRRLNEEVAQMRRALPPGGEVRGDYRFRTESGDEVGIDTLFGDKDTLVLYSAMFGAERKAPCPMCTNLVDAWDGVAPGVRRRAALAVSARAPIDRLVAFKHERGWRWTPFVEDITGAYTRDYHGLAPDGSEVPALHVFTRKDGKVRHFWAGEMGGETADPGQDPRGAPDASPLWAILDMTPEGRPEKWYPTLADREGMHTA